MAAQYAREQLPAALTFLAALAIAAFAYAPGLTGSFHFDDPYSLGGLSAVNDTETAFRYIVGGEAGPLGRPLALASFVLQAYAWPGTPEVFLYVNVCLHLLNGALVVWLLYLLGTARDRNASETAWVAAMAGGLWMLLPILASSSLLIVQRMTTLSASWVLLGLIAYLYSRRALEERPIAALAGMAFSVGLGTMLAALSKESGLLLPLFVLVAEATLLPAPSAPSIRPLLRTWRVLLLLPAAALAVYLAVQLQHGEGILLRRGFTAADRALTEVRILWQYLFHAFFPAASNLGPFHDDEPLVASWTDPVLIAAAVGWAGAIAAALLARKRVPLAPFALAWYLCGHALESTTVPLELYFEHRNYLPLIGPVYALTALVAGIRWRPALARGALGAYALVLAAVLSNTTTLWGRPALAAEMWAIYNPASTRATQYLAQQVREVGDDATARRVLRRYLEQDPGSVGVALQVATLSCLLEPDASLGDSLDRIQASVPRSKFEHGVFESIQALYALAAERRCRDLEPQKIYALANQAAANPAYRTAPLMVHNLHVLMAEHALLGRDLGRAMRHIEAALEASYTMTTLTLGVQMLTGAGLSSAAADLLKEARKHAPRHPIRAALWQEQLHSLERSVNVASRD